MLTKKSKSNKKILAILGPTATGKTDLALKIAQDLDAEIVSCDSRQLYSKLDIGTGKLPGKKSIVQKKKNRWVIDGVNVWMYDVASFKRMYTVSDYHKKALSVIKNISNRGKLVIIAGGTGYYFKALEKGFANIETPSDQVLKSYLEKLSLVKLQEIYRKKDPQGFLDLNNSDLNNKRRLVRRIEIASLPQKKNKKNIDNLSEFQLLKIGLYAPKEILDQRIDLRVLSRIDQGMVNEAKLLHKKGLTFKRMEELGLEYKYLSYFLQNKFKSLLGEDSFVSTLQIKIHQYAKRQLTWFKRDKDIIWIDIATQNWQVEVEKLVYDWYNRGSSKIK